MNNNSTAAASKRGPMSMRARLAVAQLLTGLLLAGTVTATAVPALASRLSAPSVARTARNGTSSPAPVPKAFFGLGPASKTKLDGRSYFAWGATPGAQLSDYVAIVNLGARPLILQVFASDAESLAQGTTGFMSAARSSQAGPASWITIQYPNGSSTLHLAARSQVILPVTVRLPANAPPGDHVGAIIASLTSSAVSKNHARVHLVQQVALRTVIRIAGPLHPRLSIIGLRVDYADPLNPVAKRPATLWFTVSNTGNVLLGGRVSVSVHGLFGSTETRTNVVTVPILLPNGAYDARVTVNGVYPELLMNAKVTVTPLVVPGQYDPGLTTYSGQASFLAIPWIALAIVILLVLLVVGLWLRRRRRRRRAAVAKPLVRPPLRDLTGERPLDQQ